MGRVPPCTHKNISQHRFICSQICDHQYSDNCYVPREAVMSIPMKLLLGVCPLLLTLLFGWLIIDGYVNFGGGEKEVFLLMPPLVWSLVYLCCYLAFWWRRSTVGRALVLSASFSTVFVVVAWLILFGSVLLK